ncbi:MAG: hypothetical protein Hyperionvirus5_56 [Hyperionvirus sp.]|uniref:Uncharacterized protein n=1 Tax=Hyperionvirus sp. TaxID=2487770 RepID=A0A3G5A7J8_9VIRU|nr:MAG: hypothetical protein Hyperionvirus5_56 [Hyperionvirus sp.]
MKYPQTYFIHDNGGLPFKVIINNNTVLIHKMKNYNEAISEYIYEATPFLTFNPKTIFIGHSPSTKMTIFSGGHGPDFDGNSILLHMEDLNYIYIGESIFSFNSYAQITNYVSPVGNNDVPYPYAIDCSANIYLLIENVVLKHNPKRETQIQKYDDPYSYYYDYNLITSDEGLIPPKHPKTSQYIKRFFIGEEEYTLRYVTDPQKNYDRSTSGGKKIYFQDASNKKTELTKQMYINLMNSFAADQSYEPIKNKIVLQKRFGG